MLSASGTMAGQATVCPMAKMGDPPGNVCTANDVNLAAAVVGFDSTGAICFPGEQFTIDLEADLTVRSQTRWDIGVWIAQDGKALDVSSAAGGSASCEVVPLPATDHNSDNWTTGDPPSISSFDDSPDATPASQDLCGDTDGLANNDPISGVELTFGADPAVFNGPVTLSCIAGPGGGVVLNSLVSWNQNDPGICDPTDTDTYDLATSKCSTATTELEVDIVGRVTIVKSAPNGAGQDFGFAWTNDSPPADTTLNPPLSTFTLQDTQSEEIYAVIGDDGTATVTVNEQNLPVGWQLNNIQCTGDDTTQVAINGSEITVTLSYDANDPLASQDDVVCTYNNEQILPELTLDKTGTLNDDDGTDGVSAGDSIDYAFTVENTGNVLLTNVIVTDPVISVSGGPIASFPEGAIDSTTFTGTYIITQADIDAGSFTNTATVDSDEEATDDGSDTQDLEQVPGLTLDKTADPMTYSAASQPINYEFQFTNSGNVTLHAPYTVTDDVTGDEACPPVPASLAPGELVTCTGTYNITQADVDAGSVTNTASGTALDPGDQTVTSNEDSVTIVRDETGTLILLKTASPQTYDTVGAVINYTYRLTNGRNDTLSAPYTIDDDISTDEVCPDSPASLAPGEFVECTATYTITQADLDARSVTNTATGTAQDPGDQTVTSNEDSETVDAIVTGPLTLVKTATPQTYEAVDEVISYSYELTNNMNISLYPPYAIDDDIATDENCPDTPNPLAPGGSVTCTATHTITAGDIAAGFVTNTATGTAQDAAAGGATVTSNQDSETVNAISGSLTLVKTAIPQTYDTVGDVISYSYLLTNDTSINLYPPYTIDDDISTDEVCPNTPNPLVPGGTVTCTASHTIDQADLDGGSVVNVASGTAQDAVAGGATITSNTDTETVTAIVMGPFVLVKTADPQTYSAVGDVISYSYELTNNMTVDLYPPYVIDDDIATDENCPDTPNPLAPGGSVTCTATHTIIAGDIAAGFVTNIATGTAQDAAGGGETVTSNVDTETVNTVLINLAKTAAAPSYDAISGRYTVVYTITASNSGTAAGTYDLTDTLIPATGITMFSAVIAYTGGETQTGTTAGPLPYSFSNGETVVTDEGLAGGASENWTVIATFDVDPTLIDGDARSCVEGDEQPGAGFYNLIIGVDGEEDTTDNDACFDLPDPSIDLVKTAENTTFDGVTYSVVYTVTANNLADGPGFYDLTDTILPGNDISVVLAQLTAYNAGTENSQTGTLAGVLPYTFVSPATLVTGEALAGGRNESWTIEVEFGVDSDEPDDTFLCSVIDGGAGNGLYNEVEGSASDPDDSNNNACANPGGGVATFFVTKDFIPDNAMEVEVFISCNDGLPLTSDKVITEDSDGVTFIVELFTPGNLDCEITEVPVPPGFDDSYVAGALGGGADFIGDIGGCQFGDVTGGDFTCEITNRANDAIYTVTKFWDVMGTGGEQVDRLAYVTIFCNNEILSSAPDAYDTGNSDDEWWATFIMYGETDTAAVTVDSTDEIARCRASESLDNSWVDSENGCREFHSIPLGGFYGCTITNTVFFEGIPTLNRYSLALLALLMLGIGAVGFRRFS